MLLALTSLSFRRLLQGKQQLIIGLLIWTVPHLGRNYAWKLLGNQDSAHSAHLLQHAQKVL